MSGNVKNILSMVMLLILAGCATVDSHWQQANSANTVQGYESFLRRYPRSDYTAKAWEKIEALHWQETTIANTVQGYESFLRRYPRSDNAARAREKIEALHWQEATAANTVKAYGSFLKSYPHSDYSVKARAEIESLQWQEAATKPSIPAFRRYLALHPDGEHATDAKSQLELLEWETAKKANSLSCYEGFREKYPTSRYSAQAQAEIQTFAKVVIDLPKKIAAGARYKVVFTETNGVGVVFKEYNYILVTPDGSRYTRRSVDLVESEWIKVPAKGKGIESTFVPKDWGNGSKVIDGWYGGQDANGHYIKVTFSYDVTDN